ncbi:lysophospholipid acyltransferase family protein [Rhodoplanes sp. TEM]|uniref:Lysophospholipid acyltransferase family protein n=1 Tax=Rhodoplanes tepidamans TaxID=200616 RepID=A0ABT5JFD6_RHOTP|nr:MULTISPECIES: lysophospholipid acyltransferase family protein [Rhodoplanes]MDC7788430.1 lysophospholipid acyltransferase family protein [Rhodoplanes tepidamans]MDC7983575.1 lysophospholipid acyltransferase family protein [Rhodoplanes sp. TEM]MDQ0354182.1 1-acyl-sn-glycerol-3-phosphate acyltransferase [Rhodoplanes tepidamans]
MLRLAVTGAGFALATAALLPVQWVSVRFTWPLRRLVPTLFHRIVCLLFGVRVREVGRPAAQRPLLIVSNHVSWLDIAVITSRLPVVFVAKSEIAAWPLFGLFAKLQRSVFVDRARRQKTREVNAEIAERLAGGDPVVLFGEGTSSDGNRVLPFRSALIGAAGDALAEGGAVTIQPLSIAYTGFQGIPMGRQHRPVAAWYGAADLVPHLLHLGRHGGIDVTLTWGAPVRLGTAAERKAVARSLETSVRRLTAEALRGRAGARR